MQDIETILRDAGRQRRRVLINFSSEPGQEFEREMEPYAIRDGELYAFSYFRDEFRTLAISDIKSVEVTPRSFEARRPIEL